MAGQASTASEQGLKVQNEKLGRIGYLVRTLRDSHDALPRTPGGLRGLEVQCCRLRYSSRNVRPSGAGRSRPRVQPPPNGKRWMSLSGPAPHASSRAPRLEAIA